MRLLFYLLAGMLCLQATAQFENPVADNYLIQSPFGLATADFNADGYPDLVAAGSMDSSLGILLNAGDGDFLPITRIEGALNGPRSVNTADFNADGHADLVVASAVDNAVRWYAGNGDGSFQPAVQLPGAVNFATHAVPADLDGDGLTDVVACAQAANQIVWFRNNGNGEFEAAAVIAASLGGPRRLAATDLDNDGDTDLVVCRFTANRVSYLLNNGNGTFSAATQITAALNNPIGLTVADFNNDGFIDVAACGINSNDVRSFTNDAGSGFSSNGSVCVMNGPSSILATDIDGNGLVDAFVGGTDEIVINTANDTGLFAIPSIVAFNMWQVREMVSADFDLDGLDDLAAASEVNNAIIVNYQTDTLQFNAKLIHTFHRPRPEFLTGNLDDDGLTDLILLSSIQHHITWRKARANGRYVFGGEISPLFSPHSAVLFDRGGDGDSDFIATTSSGGIHLIEQTEGGFLNPVLIDTLVLQPGKLLLADMNLDGFDDLLAASNLTGSLWMKAATDDSNFSGAVQIAEGVGTVAELFVSDFDGNGLPDVLLRSAQAATILMQSAPDVYDALEAWSLSGVAVSSLDMADLDSDGDDDIAMADHTTGQVNWVENTGNGTFAAPQPLSDATGAPTTIRIADIDFDSTPEIAAISRSQGSVWLLSAPSEPAPPVLVSTALQGLNPSYFDFADHDGNTTPDLIIYCDTGEAVHVMINTSLSGCTEPAACNYDPSALYDDNSCCTGDCGCTDPLAINYNPNATCPTNTCEYQLSGMVFHDANANGTFDAGDYPLSAWPVTLLPEGLVAYTDQQGVYLFPVSVFETASISVMPTAAYPGASGPLEIELSWPPMSWQNHFALLPGDELAGLQLQLTSICNEYLCATVAYHTLSAHNTGNAMLSGALTLTPDAAFSAVVFEETTEPFSGAPLVIPFDELVPGEIRQWQIGLHTPGVESIGEFLPVHASASGITASQSTVSASDSTLTELTCAYDPNDKQPLPVGYAEPHFILGDTPLQYTIRFQNTGNAAASLVVLRDTLSVLLDHTTLEILDASHHMSALFDPSMRLLQFTFPNIQLPPAEQDTDASQGFVRFTISPVINIQPGEVITNEAFIYFDQNPPIQTNEPFHTVFDCGDHLAEFSLGPYYCTGDDLNVSSNAQYIETHTWLLNDEPAGSGAVWNTLLDESLTSITHIASNPICIATVEQTLVVHPIPEIEAVADNNLLQANGGAYYQWYFNGNPIDGANDDTYLAEEPGIYVVQGFSEWGCTAVSDQIEVVVGVSGEVYRELTVYPVPARDRIFLAPVPPGAKFMLFDITGRCLSEGPATSAGIPVENLAEGCYALVLSTSQNHTHTLKVVVER